jgi:prepilin-type processing-associated H-X9-DG protein
MSIRGPRGAAVHVRRAGFVFMELLVVVGIISTLVALLLPALTTVRAQSRMVICQSNVRQLLTAVNAYAVSYGQYPPNVALSVPEMCWYDRARLGQFVSCTAAADGSLIGGIMLCPADEGSLRSYAMNTWASSLVDARFKQSAAGLGTFWSIAASDRSRLVLIAEKWANGRLPSREWVAQQQFGFAGNTPGQRFGVNGGVSLPRIEYGWQVNCELPFARHRPRNSAGTGTQPIGRVTIGYADGHVEMKSNDELADAATGLSTLDSLWSPLDPSINH